MAVDSLKERDWVSCGIFQADMPRECALCETLGDRINLHPHLHFLATEGGVDNGGIFHKIPRLDDSRLAELFCRGVLAFLVRMASRIYPRSLKLSSRP